MFNRLKIKRFVNKSIKQANQQVWEEDKNNKRFEVFLDNITFVKTSNNKLNAILEITYLDKSGYTFYTDNLEYKDPLFQSKLFSQFEKFIAKCKNKLKENS